MNKNDAPDPNNSSSLTLFRMSLFGAAHYICCTYAKMMKLSTVILYLKKIQKMNKSRDKPQ